VDGELSALLLRVEVAQSAIAYFEGYSFSDFLDIAARPSYMLELLEERGVTSEATRCRILNALTKERQARGMNEAVPPPINEGESRFSTHHGLEIGMRVAWGDDRSPSQGLIVSLDGDGKISAMGFGQQLSVRLERSMLRVVSSS